MNLEILIPVYNEQEVFGLLTQRLEQVFTQQALVKLGISKVTVTFIDDGSKDTTVQLIRDYLKKAPFATRLIKLSRNFGHQSAVTAGLKKSVGDYVAIIDADLQDPPEVILDMYVEARKGYDVIYGVRKKRKESFVKRFAYWSFYRLYRFLSSIQVPLDSGDFCLMSRRVVDEVNNLSEIIRFPRGIRSWVGYNQKGFEYERHARAEGESKYKWSDLYVLASNGITSLSVRPLKLTQLLVLTYLLFSLVFTIYFIFRFFHPVFLQKDTLVLLVFISVSNMLLMGVLHIHGSYLGRTYLETKGRPNFIVEEISSNEK